MGSAQNVVVYGAYGHTGRFMIAELRARGYVPLPAGRDAAKLQGLTVDDPGLEPRPASVDDPEALDRALKGADAVINCAGPFAVTAAPLLAAALRAGIPYVDVAAEIEANAETFSEAADRAREAGVAVVPAMAFYGGLGDMLATVAMGDWTEADEAHVAYGLSSWHPTAGTRVSGVVSRERRGGRRVRFTGGQLAYHDEQPPIVPWDFPQPLGATPVTEFTLADAVTIPSHLPIPEVRTFLTAKAAAELVSPQTPAPTPVDVHGRSAQTFLVDVVLRRDGAERRATAAGQDIYAVSAPLAAEAIDRILTGRTRTTGVASAGAMFDAADFLRALSPHVEWKLEG